MKIEKVIFSFIGTVIGLLVAGGAFYFYNNSHPKPPEKKVAAAKITPTPTSTSNPSFFLTIDEPKDESVSDTKTIKITGKTISDATVIISTAGDDQIATASSSGDFSTSATIDNDENQVLVTSIAPSGDEIQKTLTVTYSTETF